MMPHLCPKGDGSVVIRGSVYSPKENKDICGGLHGITALRLTWLLGTTDKDCAQQETTLQRKVHTVQICKCYCNQGRVHSLGGPRLT